MHTPDFDRHAVVSGAVAGLVVIVPAALAAQVLVGDDASTGWAVIFFAVTVFGLLSAGFGGARLGDSAPLSNGLLAALTAWAVLQGFGVIRRLVAGDSISWGAVLLAGLVAATCGVLGAVFSSWFHRKIDAAEARSWGEQQPPG